jgi:hypothetical protein
MVQRTEELPGYLSHLFAPQFASLALFVQAEHVGGHMLEDDEDVAVLLKDIQQLDHVHMALYLLKGLEFPLGYPHMLHQFREIKSYTWRITLEFLDRHLLACLLILCLHNISIGPTSNYQLKRG